MVTRAAGDVMPRLDSLTSLRALAAFAVFLSHAYFLIFPAAALSAHLWHQGTMGVSFFYTLSGFVLTWSHRAGQPVREFYRHRVARVVPAYFVAAALGTVVTILERPPVLRQSLLDILPSVAFLQSWIPRQSVYYGGNGVGWSLSCEAFFYLLFPLLLMGFRVLSRRGSLVALACCALVTLGWPALLHPSGEGVRNWATYVLPAYRVFEFCAGMLLALLLRRGYRSPLGVGTSLVLALVVYVLDGWAPYWAQYTTVPAVFMALLVYAAASAESAGTSSRALTVLKNRGLLVLGQWSFCFYLVHQLVIKTIQLLLPNHPIGTWDALGLAGVAAAGAVVCAALLFVFVERPAERRLRGDGSMPVSAST